MKSIRILAAALLLLSISSSAHAGWVINEKIDGEVATVTYYQGNKIRIDDEDGFTLMNLDEGTLTIVNAAQKIYWVGKPEDIRKAMEKATEAMRKELSQQMDSLTPEEKQQRMAMLDELMGSDEKAPKPKVEVVKTGESKTIAGYTANKYEIRADGELRGAWWIAPDVDVASEIDEAKFMAMIEGMGQDGGAVSYLDSPAVIGLWSKGAPLAQADYDMGDEIVVEAYKVEKKELPGDLFAPPAGFRKVTLQEILGG